MKSEVAENLNRTKGLGESTASVPNTQQLDETMREGMTLIDRFYNGGNMARPGVADILVVVLDQVIGRMRQGLATRVALIEKCNDETRVLDSSIGRIRPKQNELKSELEIKKARAAELRRDIKDGTDTLNDSVAIAKEALHKAKLATKAQQSKYNAEMKTLERGYDGRGRHLPGSRHADGTCPALPWLRTRRSSCVLPFVCTGREVNMRKNPNGPAARKAGDMLKDLQLS